MLHIAKQTIKHISCLILAVGLLSCSSARTVKNSFIDNESEDQYVAKVYFIRSLPVKFKGVADSRITIDINGEPLLKIDEGAYTLLKIKPTKSIVTTHSRTLFTTKYEPINVSRTREYNFIAGKTYFINLERINEEFRGIYYDPAPVNLDVAKRLSKPLRAVGKARSEPIAKINKVDETPTPGTLTPALPENLYPDKPYLLKGNPKYVAPKQPAGKNEITFDTPPKPEKSTDQKQ